MKKPKTNKINLARVSTVKNYIDQHYNEDLALSKLSEVVSLVPTSLCHIFKDVTGMKVSDYIIRVRISHAVRMLRTTDKEVKSIAYECGFNTLTNFNRHFKHLMGCTPTELRYMEDNQ